VKISRCKESAHDGGVEVCDIEKLKIVHSHSTVLHSELLEHNSAFKVSYHIMHIA
jgi:hypothetical protein